MTQTSRLQPTELARRRRLAAAITLVGVLLIAVSFVWPTDSIRRGAWSTEQAKRYQDASKKLHSLSHDMAHAHGDKGGDVRKEFGLAKAEYDALRRDLDSAISRPSRWTWIMRFAGMLAAVLGGILLYRLPPDV